MCVRKSDGLEVSDQRCEHLPRPVAETEPCNTDCEVRCAFNTQRKTYTASQTNSYRTQTFFYILSHTGGMSLERVNVLLNAALVIAAWMSSV